ncbi:MAG: hypothetical protein FWD77_10670 [Betaproteobacteria bacterium]|nr:hypothetical protein [Betaproteobacteria bacterium]
MIAPSSEDKICSWRLAQCRKKASGIDRRVSGKTTNKRENEDLRLKALPASASPSRLGTIYNDGSVEKIFCAFQIQATIQHSIPLYDSNKI